MADFVISTSISQLNSPSILGSDRTPSSARVRTPINARDAYPKRDRTPQIKVSTYKKPTHFVVRRETDEVCIACC